MGKKQVRSHVSSKPDQVGVGTREEMVRVGIPPAACQQKCVVSVDLALEETWSWDQLFWMREVVSGLYLGQKKWVRDLKEEAASRWRRASSSHHMVAT